jgi:hypothetical protein
VRSANTDLTNGLSGLTADLSTLAAEATNADVCLGPAATAELSRSADLASLRAAITRLATADPAHPYQVGVWLPSVTQDQYRSQPTGTVVAGHADSGQGWLTITNGGTTDATVSLVADGAAPSVTVYVGQGQTYTLEGIPDGVYQLYVTSGADWDPAARLFSRSCQFQQFDYTTTDAEATTYTVTLTPVIGGNASMSTVDPGQFPH